MTLPKLRLCPAMLAVLCLGSGAIRLAAKDDLRDAVAVQRLHRERDAALRALNTHAERVREKHRLLDAAVAEETAAVGTARDKLQGDPDIQREIGTLKTVALGKKVDKEAEVAMAKAKRLEAQADLATAQAAEKAAQSQVDVKEGELGDFLGRVEPPQWMGLYVLAGVNDLIKANTSQGASNIKGASIEFGAGNPSRWDRPPDAEGKGGVRFPGYHLGGFAFTLLNSDPIVVASQDATTGATKISTQKTYASKSRFEGHYRFMYWVDSSTQERAWGLILAGARVISDTNSLRTTTTGDTTTVEQLAPPTSVQYTTWKAAMRFEFTYGSGYVYQGSFAEAGWLRDPGFSEKQDRLMFRGRWAANILGGDPKKSGRFFVEGQYLTGMGAQDRASVIVGYQSNLTDIRKAMGF